MGLPPFKLPGNVEVKGLSDLHIDLQNIQRTLSAIYQNIGGLTAGVLSFNGRTGVVTSQSGDYTVGQVTGAAPLASPTFTGTPAAPTPATSDNSTKIATTAFVKAQGFISTSLTSAHILVGNAGAVATDVAMSGDVSITNTGATTVGSINGKAITLGGSFTTSGASALTLTTTGATNVTLPTTGTLLANALTSSHIFVGSGAGVATDVAMSGDATLANTGAITFATVNGNVGGFTNASITVNAKGLITAASSGSSTSGTVTSVATGTGLTGGTITTTGTISLASISTGTVLANTSGLSAAPTPNTVSAILDTINNSQGDILYRDSAAWLALAPGTAGKPLVTGGAAANPSWTTLGVVGGGTGAATLTAHAVLLGEGTSTLGFASIGTSGRLLIDQGASTDPAFTAVSGNGTINAAGALAITSVQSGATGTTPVITDNSTKLATTAYTANAPRFMAYLSGTQSGITSATWTKVTLSSPTIDTASAWSSSNHWYVVPTTGIYRISGTIQVASATSTAGAQVLSGISKNGLTGSGGSEVILGTGNQQYTLSVAPSIGVPIPTLMASLIAGDTIELDGYITGTTNNFDGAGYDTWMMIEWAGP